MIKAAINLLSSLEPFRHPLKVYILCFSVYAMQLLPISALSIAAANIK